MAKKKVKHISHEKSKVAHVVHKKKSNFAVWLIVIAVLVVAAAAYYFMTSDKVVASVNGEKIFKSEVESQLKGLKGQYGDLITFEIALNQTIIEKLLMQEAKSKGISVDDAKLDAFIEDSLSKSGSTIDTFKATLKEQNMTFEGIRERIRVQLTITELVNQTFSSVDVLDSEVKEFYDSNKQLFSGQKYEVVRIQIVEYLKSQKQMKQFQTYVLDLRSNADVVIK